MQDYFFLQCDEIEVQFLLVFRRLQLKQIKTELITKYIMHNPMYLCSILVANGFSLVLHVDAHVMLARIMVIVAWGCFTNCKFAYICRPDRKA